ncbi:MAG: hypothetical protein ACJ72N_26880 [Labedaea sp.]
MRWVLPVVLVTLIVTAAATIVARQLYADPAPSASGGVLPGTQTVPPGQQPGAATVVGTKEATGHPLYPTVRELLQTYFDAINARRYDRWQTVVSQRRATNEPERAWRMSYRSTRDGNIVAQRIELGPGGSAEVLLGFTSVQDLEDAPLELHERCIRWRIVLPLLQENGSWKVDSGPPNQSPQHERC